MIPKQFRRCHYNYTELNSANLAAATTTANTIYEFGVHDYEDPDGQNITNCNESYLQSLTVIICLQLYVCICMYTDSIESF